MSRSLFRSAVSGALGAVPRNLVVPVLTGPLRGARWVFGAANNSNWAGTFEPVTQRLFVTTIRPGSVVWDVGANVGFFTLLASRLVTPAGRVVAFEPLPRNLAHLRRHLQINGMTNVDVRPAALAGREGRLRFGEGVNHFSGGLRVDGTLEVDAETGDALCERRAVREPDFIKMDIEGGESEALAGCEKVLRRARPPIVLSAHGTGQFERCSRFLEGIGYRLRMEKDGTQDGDYLLFAVAREAR